MLGVALPLSLGAMTAPAGAVVSGEFGLQRREAAAINATIPLQYHGGPVAQASDTYPIYWDPTGAYRGDWMSVIDGYFHNVGAASGQLNSVFSLDSQYTDLAGAHASYQSTLRGPYTDINAYPPNGCSEPEGEPVCLTDAQIRTELKQFIEANHLPTGVNIIYFVLTPPGVTVCTDEGGHGNCSDSTSTTIEEEEGKTNGICGYHSAIEPGGASPIVYGVQPWVAGDAGHILQQLPLVTAQATQEVTACQNGAELDEPNQTGARSPFDDYETGLADVIVNDLSIEQNDIVVDPLLNGWYQEGTDAEQSDMCQRTFSPAPEELPRVPQTTHALNLANESIDGQSYYLQWAFDSAGLTSGKGVVCWEGTELTPRFTAPNPVNAGDVVGFDANESGMTLDANTRGLPADEPFTAPVYGWDFGDGTVVSGANDASEYHSYQYGGTYKVTLTRHRLGRQQCELHGADHRRRPAPPVAGRTRRLDRLDRLDRDDRLGLLARRDGQASRGPGRHPDGRLALPLQDRPQGAGDQVLGQPAGDRPLRGAARGLTRPSHWPARPARDRPAQGHPRAGRDRQGAARHHQGRAQHDEDQVRQGHRQAPSSSRQGLADAQARRAQRRGRGYDRAEHRLAAH